MDLTFLLSAAIFTLLALVVATSLLSGNGHGNGHGPAPGSEQAGETRNGHAPEETRNGHAREETPQRTAADDWCDISGSAHDHWDVVKSVQSVSRARYVTLQ